MFHVNVVEAIWLIISTLGVIFTALLLLDSLGERETVRDLHNGRQALRLFIVRGNIRRESIRLVVQCILFLVAIPSAIRPGEFNFVLDLSTPESSLATASTVAVLGLMCIPVGMTVSSFYDARDRRRIREMAAHLIHEDSHSDNKAVLSAIAGVKSDSADQHEVTEAHLDRQDEGFGAHDQRFSED